MKKVYFYLLPICLLFTLGSCSNNEPKTVAEKFLLSVAHSDLDEAKKYCDTNTQELLAQADYLSMVPDSVKEEGKNLKVNIVSVKENGDKAVVTYTTSKLPENQIVTLTKIDGLWKVQLDKMQDQEEEMMMPAESDIAAQDSTTIPNKDTSNR